MECFPEEVSFQPVQGGKREFIGQAKGVDIPSRENTGSGNGRKVGVSKKYRRCQEHGLGVLPPWLTS